MRFNVGSVFLTYPSWDQVYHREIGNYREDNEDQGTIWFSDSGAEEKVEEYLENLAEEGILAKNMKEWDGSNRPPTTFLDIGTGNGHMLFALLDAGWLGPMVGIDYSLQSIELADAVSERRIPIEAPIRVVFKEHDILSGDGFPRILGVDMEDGFDAVLDKGTFDAISLSSEDSSGHRVCETYCSRVLPLVKNGGLFIITSCNWTEEELRAWFEGEKGHHQPYFRLKDRLKYPQFTFGGKSGQSVVTLVFIKEKDEQFFSIAQEPR
jgi:SAM-dependent methyltransferase